MLTYFFFFYFVLFVNLFVFCSIVCLRMVWRDRPTKAAFLLSTVARHCWAEEEDRGGGSVLKSLSLLREKSVLSWANCEGRKCGGMDGLWREGGGPRGDQGTCLFIRLYRKWWGLTSQQDQRQRERKTLLEHKPGRKRLPPCQCYAVTQLWLNDQSRAGHTSKALFIYSIWKKGFMIHATKKLHSLFHFMQKSNKNEQVCWTVCSLTDIFPCKLTFYTCVSRSHLG